MKAPTLFSGIHKFRKSRSPLWTPFRKILWNFFCIFPFFAAAAVLPLSKPIAVLSTPTPICPACLYLVKYQAGAGFDTKFTSNSKMMIPLTPANLMCHKKFWCSVQTYMCHGVAPSSPWKHFYIFLTNVSKEQYLSDFVEVMELSIDVLNVLLEHGTQWLVMYSLSDK